MQAATHRGLKFQAFLNGPVSLAFAMVHLLKIYLRQ
jgi:hypothetical protein